MAKNIKDYEIICVACNCNIEDEINQHGRSILSKPYTSDYFNEIKDFRDAHTHSKCHVRPKTEANYKKDELIRTNIRDKISNIGS